MTDARPNVAVSVVLPVYNEATHLEAEVARVRESLGSSEFSYEIVIVDDGSHDGSADLATELAERHGEVRFIRLTENRGSGFARKVGTRAAHGEVVVWTDVDMTYPNHRIAELVRELDGADHVVGARRTEEGTAKALRVPAKMLIRRLASYLVETRIPDLNSGFRAFRRDVALQFLHLLPTGFSCVTTMTMSFLSNGYTIRYVPIDYAPRQGESKFHWWTDTKRYIVQVVRMALMYNPLRVFLPVGVVLFLASVAKLIFDWSTRDFSLSTNTLLLFVTAFNVVGIGLLADLVSRIGRPHQEQVPSAIVSSADGRAVPDHDTVT